jgi:HIV Tat-specific factor 1
MNYINYINSRSLFVYPIMSTQLPPPSAGTNSTLRDQAALFEADSRIHFSRESGTWRLENEDGSELEYDAAKGSWVDLVRS